MLNNINKIKNKWLRHIVKTITIFFLIILVLYIGVVIYRIPAAVERQRAERIVPQIHNQKLTMDDVMGTHLPPEPDSALNNSTLEGIDVNRNGIRDDVELAIFKLYPDSAKIRSGALQYAKAMQMYFRKDITNSEIFVAVIQEDGRGGGCFYHSLPRIDFEAGEEAINKAFAIKDAKDEEIQNLVFNTEIRKNKKEEEFKKYMTSYGDIGGSDCDIDPITLPN